MMFGDPVAACLMPSDRADGFSVVGRRDFKLGIGVDQRFGTRPQQFGRVCQPQFCLSAGGVARKEAARIDDQRFLPVEMLLRRCLRGSRCIEREASVFSGAVKAQPANMRNTRQANDAVLIRHLHPRTTEAARCCGLGTCGRHCPVADTR